MHSPGARTRVRDVKLLSETNADRLPAAAVSVGMFDGVHRGHVKVLALLRARADRLGVPSVVVTFDPHPRAVTRPDACPKLLSSVEDRIRLLAETMAVDYCMVLRFDQDKRQQTADDFALTTLVPRLGMRELVVGEDFACGKARQGDVGYLTALGRKAGFGVTPVRLDAVPHAQDFVRSSSTEARRLIQLGDISGACAVLERPYELIGTVTSAASTSCQVMEADLSDAMCIPAEADYIGAVEQCGPGSPWVPALLSVRAHQGSGRRTVRGFSRAAVRTHPGSLLRLRFIDRSRSIGA